MPPRIPKRERIKVGSVTLPFYPWKDPRTGRDYWRWAWKDAAGKWCYGTRISKAEAKAAARARAITISQGRLDIDAMTADQTEMVRQFLSLDPTSDDLRKLAEWKSARGTTVDSAVAQWHSHKLAELGGKESPHVRNEHQWLEKLAAAFPVAAEKITALDLQDYIESASSNAKSRKDARARVAMLWKFASDHGLFSSTAATRLPRYKPAARGAIAIWTPDEIQMMIAGCPPEFLPWLVMAAFSGLRSEEITPKAGTKPPLRWENVKRNQGFIDLPASTSKVRKRRLVPITPTLESWLSHLSPPESGIVCERLPAERATSILGALVGGWRKNALRHSYGSYRAAATRDLQALAIEMGTSHPMIEKHYREAVSEEAAANYWGIIPRKCFGSRP